MTMTDSVTLAYALEYARMGWRVIPIKPGAKSPKFDDWPDVATTDPDLIQQWWTRWPDHGIGLACGPESGVWVLDVDPDKGGDETLASFESANGEIPDTVMALTGGGGVHYVFAWPPLKDTERIANTVGQLGPGLDVRSSRGQVVVAPTIHPDTGRQYEWEAGHLPGSIPVAQAPQWLLDLVVEDPPATPEGQVDGGYNLAYARDRYDFGDGWAQRAIAMLDKAGWHSPRTDRRGVTYMVRPGKTAYEGSGASIGKIPGVTYVFTDGGEPLTPGGYRNHELYTLLEHSGDALAADSALVSLTGGWRTVIDPAEAKAMVREIAHAAAKAKADAGVMGALREAHAFLAEPEPEYDWLVPGLLERGDRLILTGAEGMGKSTLLRQLGAQMAAGQHPFTGETIAPVRVVIVDLENSARHLRRKLAGLVAIAGPELDDQHLYVVPKAEGIDLSRQEDVDWLQAIARAAQPEVLIIGPLYKMSNGDPTEETTAKPIAMVLDQIRAQYDTAILLEAHTPQASAGGKRPERPYGASLWLRWPEFGLFLDPAGPLRHWRGARDERQWPGALLRGEGKDDWPWVVKIGRDVTYMAMVEIQRAAVKPLSYRQIADVMRAQGHATASKSSVARAIDANRKHWSDLLAERGWTIGNPF